MPRTDLRQTVAELPREARRTGAQRTHRRYEAFCQKYGSYIQTGTFLEADPDYPDVVFNTTLP